MTQTAEQLTCSVPDVSCGHCRAAITSEVEKVAGVTSVEVDLAARRAEAEQLLKRFGERGVAGKFVLDPR
jgi:copper chaperone CopZ